MRQPARRKSDKGRVSKTISVPAPTGGWNAHDNIAEMKGNQAFRLINFFPSASDVSLRKGSSAYATGITDGGTATVETLASYRPLSGSHSLWAWAGTKLFNVTAAGAVGAATVTGLTNARWQTVTVGTLAGNFLLAVNGVDNPLIYDGTSWQAITGASAPFAITGVTPSTFAHINAFKARVWACQTNTMSVWYSAVGAIGGAYTRLDLSPIFKKGGYLMAMGTWTLDGGTGMDDLAAFVTSQGEIAIYKGTDPSSASTWALVGVFALGPPLSRKCFAKSGGDLLLINRDGVAPLGNALQSSDLVDTVRLTDIISSAIAEATTLYGDNFGWEMIQYPNGNMMILNVPSSTTAQVQFVMNTTTRAWCQFQGWAASCWEIHNNDLYYGTAGQVNKAWTGTADSGANIVSEGVQAFSYHGSSGLKGVRMVRPVIGWDSAPADFLIGIDTDFVVNTPTGSIVFTTATGATWDSGIWDSGVWGGEVIYNTAWYTANGTGYALAPHLKVTSSKASVRWASTDILFESGGVL